MTWTSSTSDMHLINTSLTRQKRTLIPRFTSLSINCLCLLLIIVQILSTRVHNARFINLQAHAQLPPSSEGRYVKEEPEIWALGPQNGDTQQQLALKLDNESVAQLKSLCSRCLYRTLTNYVNIHLMGRATIVLTGDIPAMWLRDSAVQMATYLPRVHKRPSIKHVLEGAIRSQAYFVLQDPWANAYNPKYVPISSLSKYDRQLGRGGWVWTRNFELDSVAYFFNFLWNYHQTPDVWRPELLLADSLVHDAIVALLKLLVIEQHHEERSPYRYWR